MNFKNVAFLACGLVLGGAAAQAGGYAAPVLDPAPVAPVIVEPAATGDWQGGYAGLTLGYAFKGEDVVGINEGGTLLGDIGELDVSGVNAGLRAGYRWQRGQWVFGPELGIEGGKIDGDTNGIVDGVAYEAESKINHMIALRFKTGYTVRPDLLVYGIAGVGRADVDYDLNGFNENYSATGYILGLGAEKQITEKWSVTGEYEYANFGKEELELGGVSTEATAKYNNIKFGVNFRF